MMWREKFEEYLVVALVALVFGMIGSAVTEWRNAERKRAQAEAAECEQLCRSGVSSAVPIHGVIRSPWSVSEDQYDNATHSACFCEIWSPMKPLMDLHIMSSKDLAEHDASVRSISEDQCQYNYIQLRKYYEERQKSQTDVDR